MQMKCYATYSKERLGVREEGVVGGQGGGGVGGQGVQGGEGCGECTSSVVLFFRSCCLTYVLD